MMVAPNCVEPVIRARTFRLSVVSTFADADIE
jgi:hypothetical protein